MTYEVVPGFNTDSEERELRRELERLKRERRKRELRDQIAEEERKAGLTPRSPYNWTSNVWGARTDRTLDCRV